MNERMKKMSRATRLMVFAPLAIIGIMIFATIGGGLVMLLWNWLAPELFGLRLITFWQALGLLALCRILFGGFGMGGGGHRSSRSRMRGKFDERFRQRMAERWEQMSPDERERFRQGTRSGGSGETTPLDSES